MDDRRLKFQSNRHDRLDRSPPIRDPWRISTKESGLESTLVVTKFAENLCDEILLQYDFQWQPLDRCITNSQLIIVSEWSCASDDDIPPSISERPSTLKNTRILSYGIENNMERSWAFRGVWALCHHQLFRYLFGLLKRKECDDNRNRKSKRSCLSKNDESCFAIVSTIFW